MRALKAQLQTVIAAAEKLSPEKRPVFLQRVAARLQLVGVRFSDDDVEKAVRAAMVGLNQNSAT
jgi:hypothetical protein